MTIPASMICKCLRCKHTWLKRIDGRPVRCPGCKQYDWDLPVGVLPRGRPRKNKQKERKNA
jgi:hypothetical protein